MNSGRTGNKKVCYVITLPDLGGAQSHVYEIMAGMKQYGYEAVLLVGKRGWLTEKADELGIRTYVIENMVREISLMKDLRAIYEIRNILLQERPSLVHCHSSKAGIVGRIAARLCNIPSVFTAHGWAFTDGVQPGKRFLYRNIENLVGYITDKIICVSEYDLDLGRNYLPDHADKMTAIHNCIPDVAPNLVRDWEKAEKHDSLNCIVVARFTPPKKNIEILHIVRDLLNAGKNIKVTFVGDGPDFNKAMRVADELQLGDSVVFLGARTDVAELLPKFDVFLLLSNWEGFPISIIEAMRAGLPVIASDVGGVKEAVKDGVNGYLVHKNDTDLVGILSSLSENYEIKAQFGVQGRRDYQQYFAVRNMLEKVEFVYRCILRK